MEKGMVYIFTGDGKGKTSAALGVAMRSAGNGMRVAMVQWYKEASWRISEHELEKMVDTFSIYPMGRGFYIKSGKSAPLSTGQVVVDKAAEIDHKEAAQRALMLAVDLLKSVDVLILDEVCNAVADRLLTVREVIDVIEKRESVHVVMTGRNADQKLIDVADLVTEMKKIKHPYDSGKRAVKGLDF